MRFSWGCGKNRTWLVLHYFFNSLKWASQLKCHLTFDFLLPDCDLINSLLSTCFMELDGISFLLVDDFTWSSQELSVNLYLHPHCIIFFIHFPFAIFPLFLFFQCNLSTKSCFLFLSLIFFMLPFHSAPYIKTTQKETYANKRTA